ncbi:MAG: type I phosphomannose isomerase catalytic subunit [Erysipelotrichaceae bacterium]
MYPIKLKPIYDKTIWGSNRISSLRNVEDKGYGTIWEISAHSYCQNEIINGEYQSMKLDKFIESDPDGILGDKNKEVLRLAYLDTKDDLSIQVHPYAKYAQEHDNDGGKTESWYILDAKEGATLVAGTKTKDHQVIKQALVDGNLEDYLVKIPVKAGDYVFINAGMLHALGKDILAIEVGQNSNTTYRFYDYNRKGPDGQGRPLHLEKSFDVTDFSLVCNKVESPFNELSVSQVKNLCKEKEFVVDLVDVADNYKIEIDHSKYLCLTNVKKDCKLVYKGEEMDFSYTENIFVPANCDNDLVILGDTRILISYVI